MLIKYYLDILAALISKAVWFLQLYISQYKELLIFIAVFVVLHRGFYADVPGSGNRTAVRTGILLVL